MTDSPVKANGAMDDSTVKAPGAPVDTDFVPPKFSVPVDSEYKSKVLRIWSWARPHHLSFHLNWIAFFMSFTCTFAAAALLPVIRQDLNLTKPELSNAGIAAVTGTVLARICMGSFCDKFGPRIGAAMLMLTTCSATFGMALVTNFAGFLMARLCIGFSLACFVTCQYWVSIMFSPNVVGTANAVAAGWGNMGGGATMLLMPLLYDGFQNLHPDFIAWRVAFFIPASMQIMIAVAILLFAQDLPLGNYSVLKKTGIMKKGKPLTEALAALKNYRTYVFFLTYGYCFGVELTVINVMAGYLHDNFELNLTTAGLLASLFGMQNLYARALGGVASDYGAKKFGMRGRLWVLFAVQFTGSVLCIVLGLVDGSLAATIAVTVLLAFFWQMAQGGSFGVVPFISKRSLGFVCGIVGAGGNVGSAITQAAFFTDASWSTASGFVWTGVLCTAVSMLLFTVYFPMWGGMLCPAKEGWTEEEYYSRDYSAAEREQGLHEVVLKFANESRSNRGFKAVATYEAGVTADGVAKKPQQAV